MGWRACAVGVLCFLAVLPGVAAAEDREFAFVFECEARKGTICMTSQYPPGQKMVLLGTRSDVCPTETRGTFDFQRGPGVRTISRVDNSRCPNRGGYFLAHIDRSVSSFRRFVPAPIANPDVVNRIDAAIKPTKFYATADDYFGGTLSRKPTCFHPIPGKDDLVIAQYVTARPKGVSEKYGPLYISVDGDIREIASEASIGQFFTLEGRYYLTYRAGCWQGCGIQAEVLVEISPEGFRRVLVDGFFGN
jgi:hypothetical protein